MRKKAFGKFLYTVLSAVATALFFPVQPLYAAPRLQPAEDKIVLVIDPGHGGENEGTLEARQQMSEWSPEKQMTLVTAQAMYEELSLYDNVEVYLTRTEDRDLSLKERAQLAADVQADFLFSIHYNASEKHNLFGTEVWISSRAPYNAYGYQFGSVQMETMSDMGLFLRGVKTRLSEKNPDSDYYGIIRECVNLSVPSVIIEHCHVDEQRDAPFCDTEEKWKEFGRADALSVAKYFGLESAALGVDYSEDSLKLAEASENMVVQSTLKDETPPDVCQAEFLEADYDTGALSVTVTAADYDSPLIYYDYSIDGGETYSPLQPWPDSNALKGTFADTFTLQLQIPSGILPSVTVRAYNLFDVPAESNSVQTAKAFRYGEDASEEAVSSGVENTQAASDYQTGEEQKTPDAVYSGPAEALGQEKEPVSFLTFLKLCLIFVALLFFFVLVSQYLTLRKRKKRRQRRQEEINRIRQKNAQTCRPSQSKKVSGERTNHRR